MEEKNPPNNAFLGYGRPPYQPIRVNYSMADKAMMKVRLSTRFIAILIISDDNKVSRNPLR